MKRKLTILLATVLILGSAAFVRSDRAFAQSAPLPTLTNVIPPTLVVPGQPVTLTVMVSSIYENSGLVPSGTVDFFAGPDNYVGSATLSPASLVGMASVTVQLSPGFYYISAQYNGDAAFDYSYSVPSIPLQILQ